MIVEPVTTAMRISVPQGENVPNKRGAWGATFPTNRWGWGAVGGEAREETPPEGHVGPDGGVGYDGRPRGPAYLTSTPLSLRRARQVRPASQPLALCAERP